MYKRILVPIDGSKTSLLALMHAIEFGREHHAQLLLLNVIEDYNEQVGEIYLDREKLENELKVESMKLLKESATQAKQLGVECTLISHPMGLVNESIATNIMEVAKKHAVDLIVIGSHGRSGLQRLLLGSVAEEVTRLSDIPVLLVHDIRKDEE